MAGSEQSIPVHADRQAPSTATTTRGRPGETRSLRAARGQPAAADLSAGGTAGVREGRVSEAELHASEDRVAQEAIALQEAIGLDVITDGEMRREGWKAPLRATLSG